MTLARPFKWIAGGLLSLVLLAVLFIAIFGWNWLRGPIQRITTEKTGRELVIDGDLRVSFGWPSPVLHAGAITFANPTWAKERHMVAADGVSIAVSLPQLLRRRIVVPDVHLVRPVVFLEKGTEGRKNWLLDLNQQDEDVRIRIDRLTLDHGKLGYDDAASKTSIRSELSTSGSGVSFSAQGRYLGLALTGRGSGGPVLAMRDEDTPYPIKFEARVGPTRIRADGTITSLLRFTAMDMRLGLAGDSLEQLYPLLGIAFPATRAYTVEGHLLHDGNTWRYEKSSGHIGNSDIAGAWQVDTGGIRPSMKADLTSGRVDIADLGSLIGVDPRNVQAAMQASAAPARPHVLPDMTFNTRRWDSVDAEVSLKAGVIHGVKRRQIENLVTHLSLRESVLKLDPFDFGVSGGRVHAVISLDGRKDPIQARATVRARKIPFSELFPTVELNRASIGEIHGNVDLAGKGNSVGRMLAGADGNLALVADGGEISKLMMERMGLHLWEMLQLKMSGDQLVKLRCAVADFNVKAGVMQASALVLDTEVTTVAGTGSIDLAQEKLDLTFNPRTKHTSIVALRSPFYVRGSFANPQVGVDKGRVAARAVGAVALAVVNPFLALIPLIDAGPGKDSDCAQLVRDASALPQADHKKAGPRS